MRILVGLLNMTKPLFGGGAKALMDWLMDLHSLNHEICILNINEDIIHYEDEFPFEFIHLREGNKISDVGNELIIHTMNIIAKKAPYDIYIGCGEGAGWKGEGKSLASYLKETYPNIKTINLIWDLHTLWEKESDCDICLHGAPYELIKHPKTNPIDKKRTYLIPKQNSYTSIYRLDFEEWKKRPYDFVFNNPSIYKGSPLVINLALNLPDKRFLVKKGTWAIEGVYDWYEKWIDIMRDIPNIDIIDTVEDMENGFFRQGRYLLYPSVSEGFGLMPLEAAMQGTIPICADTEILRFSSSPFSVFVYSDAYTCNPISITDGWSGGIDRIDWMQATMDWIEVINRLENNLNYTKSIYDNMEYVEEVVEKRYKNQLFRFLIDIASF